MRAKEMLKKNLKLLFRNKESAFTIVAGPILIILLVSFAFLGSSGSFDLRIAVYPVEQNAFAGEVIDQLGAHGYGVSVYAGEEECIDSVRTGAAHACMVVHDKAAGRETVPVEFWLDLSRINIVYEIAEDLGDTLEIEAESIRRGLAEDALARMQTAAQVVEESATLLRGAESSLSRAGDALRMANESLAAIPRAPLNVSDVTGLSGLQQGLAANARTAVELGIDQLEEARRLINDLEQGCSECDDALKTRAEEIRDEIEETEDRLRYLSDEIVGEQLARASLTLNSALNDIDRVREMMEAARVATLSLEEQTRIGAEDVSLATSSVQQAEARLSYASALLRNESADAETIARPIDQRIHSITVSDDRLSFAYPYLLLLVIMFIGMLLASTLVVADKTSRAAFRNFTTPVRDGYHVAMAFVTAFCILFLEVLVIVLLSGLFIAQGILLNPLPTTVLLVVSIALFTFLGMIIGYLSRTQEAAMIASISVGSVLLFVSNLVLPVEGMTQIVQALTRLNPYVVLSELLKRSMLYGVSMGQVSRELLAVLAAVVVLLVLTIVVQRRIKRRYFRQEEQPAKHIPAPLQLNELAVHDALELMEALDKMTRAEFERLMQEGNVIARWVELELKNRRLARRLRTGNKEKMILRLDRYLARHGKRMRR